MTHESLYVILPGVTPQSDDKAAGDNDTSSGDAAESPAASENEPDSSSSPAAAAQGTRRDIYAESTSSQHDQHVLQDAEADAAVTAVDEIAYQKLRGSKETIYTKLKNRIRTLEDNLNLTNR